MYSAANIELLCAQSGNLPAISGHPGALTADVQQITVRAGMLAVLAVWTQSLPVLLLLFFILKIINPRHLFITCLQILLAMVNPLNFAFTVHDVYKNCRWNYKPAIQSLVFFLLRCNNELDKNKVDPGISIQKLSLEIQAVVCKPMFLCQYNNGISTPINNYRSAAGFLVDRTS